MFLFSIIRFNISSPSYSQIADRSIPSDSMPIILRGGRFVIASRVLPTKDSALEYSFIPERIVLSLPDPSSNVNFNSFLDFGTSSQALTFTTLKSDFENVSKSTQSSNNGSTLTFDRSIFIVSVSGSKISYPSASLLAPNGFMVGIRKWENFAKPLGCLLYTSPSPRDRTRSRMPSSA